MADEYKIRIVCNNPACGETFFLVDEAKDEEHSFTTPKEALDFRKKLEKTTLGSTEIPDFYECPRCNSMPYRTEVQHLVVRCEEGHSSITVIDFDEE